MPAGSSPLVGSSRISRSGRLEQRRGDRQPLLHAERVAPCSGPARGPSSPTWASAASTARRRARRPCGRAAARFLRPLNVGMNFGCSTTAPIRAITCGRRRGTGSPNSRISPPAGPGQAEQHPDRGGLARAVGPEEAVHAAGRHGEVEVVDGDHPAPSPGAELLAQTCGLDDEVARSSIHLRVSRHAELRCGGHARDTPGRLSAPGVISATRRPGLGLGRVVRGRGRTAPRPAAHAGAARRPARPPRRSRRGRARRTGWSRPASLMPHGTNRSYHARSTSQLSANPCMVTPRLTRMPIAAILRSGAAVVLGEPDAAAARHAGGGHAEVGAGGISASSSRRT